MAKGKVKKKDINEMYRLLGMSEDEIIELNRDEDIQPEAVRESATTTDKSVMTTARIVRR